MLQETYYLGAYWGSRRETAASCAHRAADMMRRLAAQDSLFERWYYFLGTEGPLEFWPDEATLARLLEAGRARRDDNGRVIDEAGFTQGFRAADARGRHARFTLGCGIHDVPRLSNACVLDLPYTESEDSRFFRHGMLRQLMAIAVEAWAPMWAAVISRAYQATAPQRPVGSPNVGWLTYFARDASSFPPLPTPARVEAFDDHGALVVLTDERFAAGNPEHRRVAIQVEAILNEAGFLTPYV